jgi:hypothetical protein
LARVLSPEEKFGHMLPRFQPNGNYEHGHPGMPPRDYKAPETSRRDRR